MKAKSPNIQKTMPMIPKPKTFKYNENHENINTVN